jgi:hypothetical protein
VRIQDLKLELSDPQREAYDELWFNRLSAIQNDKSIDLGSALLALITRLKILCNYDGATDSSSKLDALRTLIAGVGESARILVFSQFVETLRWISDRIDIPFDLLTGSAQVDTGSSDFALEPPLGLSAATHTFMIEIPNPMALSCSTSFSVGCGAVIHFQCTFRVPNNDEMRDRSGTLEPISKP